MSEYGRIERHIAKFLDDFPAIKSFTKRLYQYLNLLIHKKNYLYKIEDNTKLTCLNSNEKNGSFFGYYDKPSILNNNYITHTFPSKVRMIKRSNVNIDIELNGKKISATNAWNWQQGAMLTWIDNSNIFFNDFKNEKYISRFINIDTDDEKVINFPIYSLRNGIALSLSFERLAQMRPDYGYFSHAHAIIDDDNDGVFSVDITNNNRTLIISISDLKKIQNKKSMTDANHKVNHIDLSPDSSKFIFMHRWINNSGQKFSRLFVANIDGSNLKILSDDDMVSHCAWRNNSEIAGWMRKEEGDAYYLINIETVVYKKIGDNILKEDGHPSFYSNGRYMITDTYPDKSRMSKLLMFDLLNEELITLGEFYSPLKYNGELRCDLHPRSVNNAEKITFDSVYSGLRQQYSIDISKIIS